MNRRKATIFFIIALLSLGLLMAIGIWIYCYRFQYWDLYKTLIPIFIMLAATSITRIVQLQFSYNKSIEKLWEIMVPVYQDVIQLTHLKTINNSKTIEVLRGLDRLIDSIRLVFKNTSYNGKKLFPFENIKDIKLVVSTLHDKGNWSHERRTVARSCINQLWWETYNAIFFELQRSTPIRPISKFFHTNKSIADEFVEKPNLKIDDLKKFISPSNLNEKRK